jgi:hypothetical protein
MCNIASAISLGIGLLTSDDGGGGGQASGNSDAAGQAALRGVALQEQQYAEEGPLRTATREATIRELGRSEGQRLKDIPVLDASREEILNAGSVEQQNAKAARATADVKAATEAVNADRTRLQTSLGQDPTSAAAQVGRGAGDIANVATLAKAGTDAREQELQRGQTMRASFSGKGFNPNPQTVQAGTITSNASELAKSQAGIANQQAKLQADQQASIGNMVSNALNKVTPDYTSTGYSTGYSPGYDTSGTGTGWRDGGPVAGPGGPTEDAVPAVVDGTQPAALSSGEFVVKAESVAKYGPRLLSEVNEGTAIIVPTRRPRMLSLAGGSNAKAA